MFGIATVFLAGCGAGGYAGGGVMGLSQATATIDAGQSISITATMSGTSNMTWTLTGPRGENTLDVVEQCNGRRLVISER